MRLFVAGGSGVIGRPFLRSAVEGGHQVLASARSDAAAAVVRSAGAEPVHVDLFDGAALRQAVEGCDAVINLATSIPPTSQAWRSSAWELNHRLRREASANLAAAAREAGAERFVQESLALAYPDRGADLIDEDVPLDPFPQAATVLDAEAAVADATASGVVGIALRFSHLYGPDGHQAREMLGSARRGLVMLLGDDDAYWSMVHADDAAGAVLAAVTTAPAGTYNVVDDEPLTRAEHAAALGAAVGRDRMRRPPAVAGKLGPGKALGRSLRVSNQRLRQATGWAPRYPSTREGWQQAVVAATT